tara:strand:- start:3477 stop:4760 length:1284 start_codon:yes stop_codon:yes gene_type:complete
MTKKEIEAAIRDALAAQHELFGLNPDDFASKSIEEIFGWHVQLEEYGPNAGGLGSTFPKDDLDEISTIYRNIEGGADDTSLTQVQRILENVSLNLNRGKDFSYSNELEAYKQALDNSDLSDANKEIALNTYIASLGGVVREVPLYKPDQIDEPMRDDKTGEILTQQFGGHFGDTAGVYEMLFTNTDTIVEFQRWLEANGLVEQGTFDNSLGQKSEVLRMQIAKYMAWIDTNKYVEPGTLDYQNVMTHQMDPNGLNPFDNSVSFAGEQLKHQKMFSYFLSEYSTDHDNKLSVLNRANTEARFKKYMEQVPGELQMEQIVEGGFFNTMGRLPTKDELKEQVSILAKSYVNEFNDMNNMYAFVENLNMIKQPNLSWQVDPNDIPMDSFVNTAGQTASEQFSETYRDDINIAAFAQEKRNMDKAMLKSMFG